MNGQDNRERLGAIAAGWIEEIWQQGRVDLLEKYHSPDFVDRSSAGRPADLAGFRRGIESLLAAFPDFRGVIDHLAVDAPENLVTLIWSATGTHSALYMGYAPTGRTVHFRGIDVIRVQAGRIVERWGEWDGLDLVAQLAGGGEAGRQDR